MGMERDGDGGWGGDGAGMGTDGEGRGAVRSGAAACARNRLFSSWRWISPALGFAAPAAPRAPTGQGVSRRALSPPTSESADAELRASDSMDEHSAIPARSLQHRAQAVPEREGRFGSVT